MTPFDVYLITILDNLKYCCKGVITFSIICLVISFIVWAIATLSESTYAVVKYKFFPIICSMILIFSTALTALTPTSKQMACIYIIPKIVNNETIQQLPENILKLLNNYLEDLLKDDDNKKEENSNNGHK